MEGSLSYFQLADGKSYFFDPGMVSMALFSHAIACARTDVKDAPRPPVPVFFKMVQRAKDRKAALASLYPDLDDPNKSAPPCAYDLDALVEDGELEPQQFALGVMPSAVADDE
jgi:hypothetical protein